MRLGRDGVPGGGRGGAPRQGQRGQGGGEGGLLERSAYILLSRVRIEGPMSIRQLSEAFDLDPSTLNRQTSAMLRAGLVERIPDPEGGIARKFRITSEGERRLDAERAQIVTGIDKIMADWTSDEVAAFAAFLQRFNTDIERLAGHPWPRP
ncbi:MarR family transcriptional regulator [Actinomadura madurae]|uniref:MarR family winged helix-turn-helix transcriptional regulator n=1 Tax=Actinomadura madurae TaxID=1993 RepID=UPI0020267066|nr:MarR family transcriptional regulator [Actinomadura madurae]MCP9965291.1 MarR family transcriptional regulator [Actinomadura madurae]MCQ0013966.1 MarR family transcriptional regulator [Actinomadura madurae]URM94159.1 MarR family transcriptional regulator [Actinomadura madurae]